MLYYPFKYRMWSILHMKTRSSCNLRKRNHKWLILKSYKKRRSRKARRTLA